VGCSLSLWRSKHFHYICEFFLCRYTLSSWWIQHRWFISSSSFVCCSCTLTWVYSRWTSFPPIPPGESTFLWVEHLDSGEMPGCFSWALQGRKNYFYFSLFVFLLNGVEHLGPRYFLLYLVIILGRNNSVFFFLFNCLLLIETTKKFRVTWNFDCEICRIFPTSFL
jgi:hypothetical protein